MNIFNYNFRKANTYFLVLIIIICFFTCSLFYYLNIYNQHKITKTINDNVQNRKITIFEKEIDKERIEDIEHVKLVLENYYNSTIEYNDQELSISNILLYDESIRKENVVIVPKSLNLKINDTIKIKNDTFTIIDYTDKNTIYMSSNDIEKIKDNNDKNYIVIVDDYNNSNEVFKKIKKLNLEASVGVLDTRKVDNIKKVIERVSIFNNIVIIISIVLIIEIYLYIFKEELKNISLLKILGYKNSIINFKLFLYTLNILLISFLVNSMISVLLNYYLIHIKRLNIKIYNNITNSKLMLIYLIVSVLFLFINYYRIKKVNSLDNL